MVVNLKLLFTGRSACGRRKVVKVTGMEEYCKVQQRVAEKI